jgi:hypothetical protein
LPHWFPGGATRIIRDRPRLFPRHLSIYRGLSPISICPAEKFVSFDKKLIKKATGLKIELVLLEA